MGMPHVTRWRTRENARTTLAPFQYGIAAFAERSGTRVAHPRGEGGRSRDETRVSDVSLTSESQKDSCQWAACVLVCGVERSVYVIWMVQRYSKFHVIDCTVHDITSSSRYHAHRQRQPARRHSRHVYGYVRAHAQSSQTQSARPGCSSASSSTHPPSSPPHRRPPVQSPCTVPTDSRQEGFES